MYFRATLLGAICALAACSDSSGVGFGPMGGEPGVLPQGTRAEYRLDGLEPLPLYRGTIAGEASPAEALIYGNTRLREPSANLAVTVEGQTFGMRQVELNGENYVIAEGAAPVASLPTAIRARTGCLVDSNPMRSEDASVYTLDCT